MTPLIAFVIGIMVFCAGWLCAPRVSAIRWRYTTDRSTGERCAHAWVRVRTHDGWSWLRMTNGELLEASRRAEANKKDAPAW